MRRIFILYLGAALALAACSKSDNDPQPDPNETTCKVTSVKTDDETETIHYDEQERVKLLIVDYGSNNIDSTAFDYQDDKIIVTYVIHEEGYGETKRETHFTLDASGKIISSEVHDKNEIDERYTYEYENNRIKSVSEQGKKFYDVTWNGDNVTKAAYTWDAFSQVRSFEYDTNENTTNLYIANLFPLRAEMEVYGIEALYEQGYLGEKSKNLISSENTTGGSIGTSSKSYTYTKDNNDNIISIKTSSKESINYQLTYKCE